MSALVLYVKPGCHLCEEAREVIREAAPAAEVREQDITQHPRLQERYGLRIPVLERVGTDVALDWPFGPRDVTRLVTD
jgi:hypothetical protein